MVTGWRQLRGHHDRKRAFLPETSIQGHSRWSHDRAEGLAGKLRAGRVHCGATSNAWVCIARQTKKMLKFSTLWEGARMVIVATGLPKPLEFQRYLEGDQMVMELNYGGVVMVQYVAWPSCGSQPNLSHTQTTNAATITGRPHNGALLLGRLGAQRQEQLLRAHTRLAHAMIPLAYT